MMNRRSQQGATLIVVLVILLLIMIIGTLAIRQSLVSLNIATNSQAQQLLTENSDAAVFKVEDLNSLNRQLAADGMFGYINTDSNKGKELVFCYRGTQSNFFTLTNASIMQWQDGATAPDGTSIGAQGYCSSSSSGNYYTSGRRAVITQISIQFVNNSASTPFSGSLAGTDVDVAKVIQPEKAIVHAISLMPTLSSASTSDIDNCLSTKMSNPVVPSGVTPSANANQSISQCLAALNVPFTTHVSEYNLTQTLSSS